MTKEYLEALDDLFGLVAFQKSLTKEQYARVQEYSDIIEQALQRLEAIDNSNPSEAMECLDKMYDTHILKNVDCYHTIKNYIFKSQEQEKVLKIIKEKEVDIHLLKACITCYRDSLNAYNSEIKKLYSNHKDYQNKPLSFYLLTQEEFDLLKEVLGWILAN